MQLPQCCNAWRNGGSLHNFTANKKEHTFLQDHPLKPPRMWWISQCNLQKTPLPSPPPIPRTSPKHFRTLLRVCLAVLAIRLLEKQPPCSSSVFGEKLISHYSFVFFALLLFLAGKQLCKKLPRKIQLGTFCIRFLDRLQMSKRLHSKNPGKLL